MANKLIGLVLAGAVGLLAACDREVIFEGPREDIRSPDPEVVGEDAAATWAEAQADAEENAARPISLPRQSTLGAWTHVAGNAAHNMPHLSFSATPAVVFEVNIGQGNDRRHRVTAEPVVSGGRVFTMDSHSLVMAHSTGGEVLWSADLTAVGEGQREATGGGLAFGAGRVFATTGFGELVAIDPSTGTVAWRQALGSPGTGAPVVNGGTVYALSANNEAFAVDAATGRVKWKLPGTPKRPGVIGGGVPAIAGNTVIMPFSLASLVGVSQATGDPQWVVPVKGSRSYKAYSILSEVTGAPVVSGSTIYAGTAAGTSVALGTNGAVRWTSEEGAAGAMVVAGGSLFMVGDDLELVRVDANTGERIWGVPLPGFRNERPRRYKTIYTSYGPTLAGGRVWVASADGVLRAFNPVDGALVQAIELPAGAASRPVIVGGVAYIVTDRGSLLALQ